MPTLSKMGLKPFLCLLASIVLLTSNVSSKDEELFLVEGYQFGPKPPVSFPPVASPVKQPTPIPPKLYPPPRPVKAKPPYQPSPIVAPPPQVPVKPPTAAPLPKVPVKPPTAAPPPKVPVKPPTAATPPQVPVKPPTVAPPQAPVPPKTRADCIPLCVERCKLHSRKKLCARACMTCCERCKCVPPGTYGNREKCGKCYTDMTTHYGRRKCP